MLRISTMAGANGYAPTFIVYINTRSAKPPGNDFDANQALRDDKNF
jgi:hypothetical protein